MRAILLLCLFSFSASAYVDLSLQYSFSKQKSVATTTLDTSDGEATNTSGTIFVNWAWYIWSYTAIEFNYSRTTDTLMDTRRRQIDTDLFINESEVETITEVKGVGLRFSFAKQTARFIPTLAFGYAELTVNGEEKYEISNAGAISNPSFELEEEESASSYITVGLRIRFTKLMGLSLSAKSVMRDFEFSEAQDNVTYSAGLSWIF